MNTPSKNQKFGVVKALYPVFHDPINHLFTTNINFQTI